MPSIGSILLIALLFIAGLSEPSQAGPCGAGLLPYRSGPRASANSTTTSEIQCVECVPYLFRVASQRTSDALHLAADNPRALPSLRSLAALREAWDDTGAIGSAPGEKPVVGRCGTVWTRSQARAGPPLDPRAPLPHYYPSNHTVRSGESPVPYKTLACVTETARAAGGGECPDSRPLCDPSTFTCVASSAATEQVTLDMNRECTVEGRYRWRLAPSARALRNGAAVSEAHLVFASQHRSDGGSYRCLNGRRVPPRVTFPLGQGLGGVPRPSDAPALWALAFLSKLFLLTGFYLFYRFAV